MEFIKELKKLAQEQEKIDDSYIDFYNGDYIRFRNLYRKKLLKSPLKKLNAKKFIGHMDIVLKYTNLSNIEWTGYDILLNQEEFVPSLIANLSNFKFPEEISELLINHIYNWLSINSVEKANSIFNGELLDYLVSLRLDTRYYESIISKMDEDAQLAFLNKLLENDVPITSISFELKGDNKKFIEENITYIANDSNALYSLKNSVSDNPKALEEINNYIDSNQNQALASIIYQVGYTTKIENDNIREVIRLIIEDVMKNEEANFSDISFKSGAFSSVLKIKNKVVKIGKQRKNDSFPNNPYIVKPLLRKTLEEGNDKCFVEVTELVDTSKKATDEELYQLYKKMRNLGLIWTDIASRNVGRLLKDNNINWKSNLEPNNYVLELDKTRGEDITLKKGELVILDADFIFDENDSKISYPDKAKATKFEERYQKEKKLSDEQLDSINNQITNMQNNINVEINDYQI